MLGLTFIADGVNLTLITMGYKPGGVIPILVEGMSRAQLAAQSAYPLPMALVLTSIVISVATVALILGMCIKIHKEYGTLSVREIWGE